MELTITANIPRIGAHTAYKELMKHKSIEEIGQKTKLDISILKHKTVRKLFTVFKDYEIESIPYCGIPCFNKLENFIRENNLWKSKENFNKLKKDFMISKVIFDEKIKFL